MKGQVHLNERLERYNRVSSAWRSTSHLQLAIFLPGQVPHAGGLQVDQPAGDLLLPLLLQVAQHAALHEHLRDTTGGKRDASSPAEGPALSALTLLEPTTTLRRSTSSSVSSSSTAWEKPISTWVKGGADAGEGDRCGAGA